MSRSSAPSSRQYRPAELKAIDYVSSYRKIRSRTFDEGALYDLVEEARGTTYDFAPGDYLRYELYPQDMLLHHPMCLGYYTTDGRRHDCIIREEEDLDEYFHILLENWDSLDLPSPEEYLGYGYHYDDVEVELVEAFGWVA